MRKLSLSVQGVDSLANLQEYITQYTFILDCPQVLNQVKEITVFAALHAQDCAFIKYIVALPVPGKLVVFVLWNGARYEYLG